MGWQGGGGGGQGAGLQGCVGAIDSGSFDMLIR